MTWIAFFPFVVSMPLPVGEHGLPPRSLGGIRLMQAAQGIDSMVAGNALTMHAGEKPKKTS